MPAASSVRIVRSAELHIPGLRAALDEVAKERRYLAFLAAPPLTAVREFSRALLGGAGVQMVAVTEDERVVGWCDIVRVPMEGFNHTGRLGMGLLAPYRGQGIGQPLAEAAIAAASEAGMTRIELEVMASNANAIRLYQRLGFVHEGVKRRARHLDGVWDDHVLMALLWTGAPGSLRR
jgi:RimJ/RimL family protein N-acetyltransferase